MNLSDICIRRPVFSIVLSLILTVVGLAALFSLPLRKLPQSDEALVTVVTQLAGASAEQMESQVSAVIENSVAGLSGIKELKSTSMVGLSSVEIKFRNDVDPKSAASEVSAKAIAAVPELPKGVTTPVVNLASGNNQPILYLGLRDPERDARELTMLAREFLVPKLKTIDGVASVKIYGEREYAMVIELDAARLAAENLTIDDVSAALNAQNATVPSGQIEVRRKLTSVVVRTALSDVSGFRNVVIARRDGYAIRVSDVGEVRIGSEVAQTAVDIDGASGIALALSRRPHSNPLDISAEVHARLDDLGSSLPATTKLEVIFDETVSIARGISEVFETIGFSIALVILTMVLFLGSWRSSAIVIVTIPVSLIATLAFLWPLGFSLNTFTLLAIVLAVGLVVDDAIVDVENVERHIADGLPPVHAAVLGSREVTMAVIATTLTLAVIYVPVGFMDGKIGHLFREFGFTLAIAVVVSGFVSRTLSPMMCSRILLPATGNSLETRIRARLDALANRYSNVLDFTLNHRWMAVIVAGLISVGAVSLVAKLPSELAPEEDQGYILVQLGAAPGTTLEQMLEGSKPVQDVLRQVPEHLHSMIFIGQGTTNTGTAILMLKPWDERTRHAADIRDALNARLAAVASVRAAAFLPPALGGAGGVPVQLIAKTNGTYQSLHAFLADLQKRAAEKGIISHASVDLTYAAPAIDVAVNRAEAQRIGIDPVTISQTISSLLSGLHANKFDWQGKLHPVIVRMRKDARLGLEALHRIYLRAASGEMVPLSSVVTTKKSFGALALARRDQSRAATLSALPVAGYTAITATDAVLDIAREMRPAGILVEAGGARQQAEASQQDSATIFGLALLLVFLLLAAQFESFRDPFIVMAAAPLALAGGLLGLMVIGGSLNAFTAIALLTLVGMITKHGILITEFANQRCDAGADKRSGLIDAARSRLRPILMTTTAAVMGALPLLLATGPGANGRLQIGVVIICGMVFGTVVSLFLVPFAYSIIAPDKRKSLVDIPGRDATSPRTGWSNADSGAKAAG